MTEGQPASARASFVAQRFVLIESTWRAQSWEREGPKFVTHIETAMSALGQKRTWRGVRPMCVKSLLFTGGGKPHQEPHCIAPKPPPWQLSDIQECFPGPRRRLGKAALRLYHTCAQCCAPTQHIFQKVLLFGGTRACCSPVLAHRCIVFEVLCRRLLRLQFCFLPEQHCSERQKLAWQQREGTPE